MIRRSRFRIALRWAQRIVVAGSTCLFGVMLTACGSGTPDGGEDSTSQKVVVTGEDGASVKFRALQSDADRPVTVRVARDGTGAPALGASFSPIGSVYQFTPMGWGETDIEIRVPFSGELNGAQPQLLISQPGGSWMVVADAQRDGAHMIARVPQLAYATVALPLTSSPRERAQILSAHAAANNANPSLSVVLTGDPALPTSQGLGDPVTVKRNTALTVRTQYANPAGCLATPTVSAYALVTPSNGANRKVLLGTRNVTTLSGAEIFSVSLSASDNGRWSFYATAECREPGKVEPRYSTVVSGAPIIVNIAASAAPVITQAPVDVSVVEGDVAGFGAVANGDSLAYEWQRSNDGGVSYSAIAGTNAAIYSFVAATPDTGALFRVRVSNSQGTVTSTPARLTVAIRPVAPRVTSDPTSQAVLAGKTASFTVAGTGKPMPGIQWQMRSAAGADPEVGWSPVAGATSATYITAPTEVGHNGRQYRAVLSNSAGLATSMPATLTVTSATVAPSIAAGPASLDVPAGESGAFMVEARGSTPLSYQWLKNGVAIVGANGSSVLIPTDLSDLGASHKISVRVSNSAGTVTSADATLTVVAARGTATSTLITASQGGVATSASGGINLTVPAGALSSDRMVTMINQPLSSVVLPEGFTPLSDAVEIGPKDVFFAGGVTMTWPSPDELPEGTVMALVKLPVSGAKVSRAMHGSDVNLRRLAAGGPRILGVSTPSDVLCAGPANHTGLGIETVVTGATKLMTAAVPEAACTGAAPAAPSGGAPSAQETPCTSEQYSAADPLVSRHVHCSTASNESLGLSGVKGSYGKFRLSMRFGSHGPARGLNKTLRFSFRLERSEPGTEPTPSSVKIKPTVPCAPSGHPGSCSATDRFVTVPTNGSWSNPVNMVMRYDWDGGDNTYEYFGSSNVYVYVYSGTEIIGGSELPAAQPTIRCDKKMVGAGDGCIYPDASPVFVLSLNDPAVLEASQHTLEALAWGAPGQFVPRSDMRAVGVSGNALQRTRVTGLKGGTDSSGDEASNSGNRYQSCGGPDAVIKIRPLKSSTCPTAPGAGCDCDEYPYNTTWNGAWFNKDRTSAKYINAAQNRTAGARLGGFYQKQRVLDFTVDPGIAFKVGNEAISIPMSGHSGADDFWVIVK